VNCVNAMKVGSGAASRARASHDHEGFGSAGRCCPCFGRGFFLFPLQCNFTCTYCIPELRTSFFWPSRSRADLFKLALLRSFLGLKFRAFAFALSCSRASSSSRSCVVYIYMSIYILIFIDIYISQHKTDRTGQAEWIPVEFFLLSDFQTSVRIGIKFRGILKRDVWRNSAVFPV
jgi:hypothetical protein